MKFNIRVLLVAVGIAVLLLIAAIGIGRFRFDSGVEPNESSSPSSEAPVAGLPAAAEQGDGVEAQIQSLADAQLSKSIPHELLSKGFPLMSNPRRTVYEQTAGQTTEEVAADLGNAMAIAYCAIDINAEAGGNQILRYSRNLSRYMKVLRLIEEGRDKPSVVSPILETIIAESMTEYQGVREEWDIEWPMFTRNERPSPVISDGDKYYYEYKRYKDPIVEFERLHDAVYSSFYILANIGTLDANTLAKWIEVDKPWQYSCLDMDVWLVDAYFRQGRVSPDAAASYRALTAQTQIGGQTVKQSSWNALWDIHHPLLTAQKVNLAEMPTIEVLQIPQELPTIISQELKEQIIQEFLEHARK
jgi:hypothetical protein